MWALSPLYTAERFSFDLASTEIGGFFFFSVFQIMPTKVIISLWTLHQ
jgi:hypothetical protein